MFHDPSKKDTDEVRLDELEVSLEAHEREHLIRLETDPDYAARMKALEELSALGQEIQGSFSDNPLIKEKD